MTDIRGDEESRVGEWLASHGGPFFDLQRRLRMLRDDALFAGRRAAVYVALAWGVPLLLSLVAGRAFGSAESHPYVLDFDAWARFLVAVGLFLLAEQQVESGLKGRLGQLVRAPILAPGSFEPCARAVARALRLRDSGPAEVACLVLAIPLAIVWLMRLRGGEQSSWAVEIAAGAGSLTPAGWWSVVVSAPLFYFLLIRGLWRYLIWGWLLSRIASLELRLVATHPDGKGGLAFLAEYPNAYSMFVFGASVAMAVGVVEHVFQRNISSTTFGAIVGGWLAIVFAVFAAPLIAFSKPLADLKRKSEEVLGAEATRFHRAAERALVGRNIVANDPSETAPTGAADPSAQFALARKLSVFLMSRAAVAPLASAALLPFAVAGATRLPYKEVYSLVKKLVF